MCQCNTSMDIRGRCCYLQDSKMFKTCPARLDTALFHLQNDSYTNSEIESNKTKSKKTVPIRAFLLKTIKLTRPDANKVIDMFWKEHNQYIKCCVCFEVKDKTKDYHCFKCSCASGYACGDCFTSYMSSTTLPCGGDGYDDYVKVNCFVCKKQKKHYY